jgi:transcription elongation factor Elf1
MNKQIRCPRCGKVYRTLAEAKTRSLGLALIATCSICGRRWNVGDLWRKTREVKI